MPSAFFRKSEVRVVFGRLQALAAEGRRRARRRRRARLGAYRRAARTRGDGPFPDIVVGILDRRGGGRLLRRRPARYARELRPLADQAARFWPSRCFLQRRRADRRRQAACGGSRNRSAPCASRTCRSAYAGVATEIGSGHEIWLKRGPLVEAMRASYALPGLFEPVRVAGRWLFDGAIVNPVPVSVARALGADRVVALNIASEGSGRGTAIQDVPDADEAPVAPTPTAEDPRAGVMKGLRRGAGMLRRQWTSEGGRSRARLGDGRTPSTSPRIASCVRVWRATRPTS